MRAGGRARHDCCYCEAESGLESVGHPRQHGAADLSIADPPTLSLLATGLIVAQHHSVDLGLMQVNSANLGQRSACPSPTRSTLVALIEAGGRVLSEAYQRALRGALSAYNTGDPQRGISNGYVSRVERVALSVPSIARPALPRLQRNRHCCPRTAQAAAGWDVFAQSGGTPFVFTGK